MQYIYELKNAAEGQIFYHYKKDKSKIKSEINKEIAGMHIKLQLYRNNTV